MVRSPPMNRHATLILVGFAAAWAMACGGVSGRSGTPSPPPTSTVATAVASSAPSTPPPQEPPAPPAGQVVAAAADWTVVDKQYMEAIDRYRLTVMLKGKERTFDASRVCFEVAVPGQVLPETIPSTRGYDIVCQVDVP